MRLTEKVLAFQQGNWTWTDLWKSILVSSELFFRLNKIPEDLTLRILAKIGPRLPAMVESFRYVGKSFEAFLHTSLRFQIKSAHREQKLEEQKNTFMGKVSYLESISKEEALDDSIVQEKGPQERGIPRIAGGKRSQVPRLSPQKKRELILAMKNCHHLDDLSYGILSNRLMLDYNWLLNCKEELRERSRARFELYRELKSRERHMLFNLQLACQNGSQDRMGQQRLKALQNRLVILNPFPRHGDIAEVLGIPKGSVDTSLFYLRQAVSKKIGKAVEQKTLVRNDTSHETDRSE